MLDTKIPYAVAMNHDSILDILVHVNTGESLRKNLAARDFIDWEDEKEYGMLDFIASRYRDDIDKLVPMKKLYARHDIPRRCPRSSLATLQVLLAFERGAERILSLYKDVLSAYPAQTPLIDLISRWSAHCWYDPAQADLAAAGSLRQYILNKFNCQNLTACAKEKMYHSFSGTAAALRVYETYEQEINKALPAQERQRADTRAEQLNPDRRKAAMVHVAIDAICRRFYQDHSPLIIAKMTSELSVQRCLEDTPSIESAVRADARTVMAARGLIFARHVLIRFIVILFIKI